MKKFFSIILVGLLLFSVAVAGAEAQDARESFDPNPNHYTLMKVFDAYIDEEGDYVVQACFGDYNFDNDQSPDKLGFDDEEVYTLILHKDAAIEMPPNMDDDDNVAVTADQFMDMVSQLREENSLDHFFCDFEMDDDCQLTKLVYYYMPF